MATPLLNYARKKGLSGHFCTAQLKDSVQMRQRLIIRAANTALPFDEQTKEGLLLRGVLYVPALVPGFGYKEKIRAADKGSILPQLVHFEQLLMKRSPIIVDEKKLRLIAPVAFVRKHASQLKKMGLVPAVIEEYPTQDAIDVTVDFI